MHHDRTVIGYHGCDLATAQRVLNGAEFEPSENDYDWLGTGVYFWEYGPDRAWRWAAESIERRLLNTPDLPKAKRTPAVIGAVIQLGNCFDLCDTRFTMELRKTHDALRRAATHSRHPLPKNRGRDQDLKLRELDCYVLNAHLAVAEFELGRGYDTVRGAFIEGRPAFPRAMIREGTHVQVAVRNPACVLGVFRPRMDVR